MGENWPAHSPWWWDRFDELDARTDDYRDERDETPEEVELERRIDSQWDELWQDE
jgi:hypothetical protein